MLTVLLHFQVLAIVLAQAPTFPTETPNPTASHRILIPIAIALSHLNRL